MKKVLILYGSYGGGHKAVANTMKQHIEENYKDKEVNMIDCIEYISKTINKITTGAYNQMGRKAPWLWKKVYFNSERGMLAKVSNGINALMSKKLCKLIEKESPDVIISTHPFSTQMCGLLKKKGKIKCKVATIMTDYEIHNQWLQESDNIDYYFVAHGGMRESMINRGVDAFKIFITGIPISNRFLEEFNKIQLLDQFGLEENKKTVLFFGGGEMGLGKEKTCEVLKALITCFNNIQIIAISGKNEAMYEAFETIVTETKSRSRVKVVKYTTKVPELMSISNIVITKAGGLTTTESVASGVPMIIINPLPGQEEQNAEFLEKKKVAVWLRKHNDVKEFLKSVIGSDEKIEQMKNNTKILAKKTSTRDICKIIFEEEI